MQSKTTFQKADKFVVAIEILQLILCFLNVVLFFLVTIQFFFNPLLLESSSAAKSRGFKFLLCLLNLCAHCVNVILFAELKVRGVVDEYLNVHADDGTIMSSYNKIINKVFESINLRYLLLFIVSPAFLPILCYYVLFDENSDEVDEYSYDSSFHKGSGKEIVNFTEHDWYLKIHGGEALREIFFNAGIGGKYRWRKEKEEETKKKDDDDDDEKTILDEGDFFEEVDNVAFVVRKYRGTALSIQIFLQTLPSLLLLIYCTTNSQNIFDLKNSFPQEEQQIFLQQHQS